MGAKKDLTGQKFGRLLVVAEFSLGVKVVTWECLCDCGNISFISTSTLNCGNTKSCGCLAKEITSKRFTTHGARHTRLYTSYTSMQSRCNIPSSTAYSNYGGRGISVCSDWDSFVTFQTWSIFNGYKEGLSLDRIDTNGNYTPENCRWVSQLIQTRNRRAYKNKTSKYIGVSWDKQYSKWTASIGITRKVVHLGRYIDEFSAAQARDNYINQNNLEGFTLNF